MTAEAKAAHDGLTLEEYGTWLRQDVAGVPLLPQAEVERVEGKKRARRDTHPRRADRSRRGAADGAADEPSGPPPLAQAPEAGYAVAVRPGRS